jgi:hypothetical protein
VAAATLRLNDVLVTRTQWRIKFNEGRRAFYITIQLSSSSYIGELRAGVLGRPLRRILRGGVAGGLRWRDLRAGVIGRLRRCRSRIVVAISFNNRFASLQHTLSRDLAGQHAFSFAIPNAVFFLNRRMQDSRASSVFSRKSLSSFFSSMSKCRVMTAKYNHT